MNYVYFTYKIDDPSSCYVGVTKNDITTTYIGSGIMIKRAVKKYGRNSFTRIDLNSFESIDEARMNEAYWIRALKTEIRFGGYNISPVGGPVINGYVSESTKIKIGNANRGRKHTVNAKKMISLNHSKHSLGKKMSKETKLKISKKQTGRLISDETKKKQSLSHIGYEYEIIMCPHCFKTGGASGMKCWHFDNCREKITA